MDVHSVISEYKRLCPKIFHQSPTRYIGAGVVKSAIGKPWFEGKALEKAVKRVVSERIPYEERELGGNAAETCLLSPIEAVRENTCKT
jgi:hypothetical protein